MIKNIFILLCTIIIFTFFNLIYIKKRKIFFKRFSFGNFLSNSIYFFLLSIMYFFTLCFYTEILEVYDLNKKLISFLSNYKILFDSGIISTFLIAYLIWFLNEMHKIICDNINKHCISFQLPYLSSSERMWAILAINVFFALTFLHADKDNIICIITISAILGKFFWLDNDQKSIKNLIFSFLELQYGIGNLYILLALIPIYCHLTSNSSYSVLPYLLLGDFISFFLILKEIIKDILYTPTNEEELKTDFTELFESFDVWHYILTYKFKGSFYGISLIIYKLFFIKLLKLYRFTAKLYIKPNNSVILCLHEINLISYSDNIDSAKLELHKMMIQYAINAYNDKEYLKKHLKYVPYILKILYLINKKDFFDKIEITSIYDKRKSN